MNSFNAQLTSRRNKSSEDSLIPLINIVFLLLIFFMVSGSIQPSIPAEIKHPTVDIEKPIKALKIQILITESNEIYVNNQLMSLAQLKKELDRLTTTNEALAEKNNSERLAINLHADKEVKAIDLDLVLNVIRQHNVADINLITQRKAES